MQKIADVDLETVEGAVLAAAAPEAEKPEKVPAHVRSFYRRMVKMLGEQGVHSDSPAAKAMRALTAKEQMQPVRPERFGRLQRQKAVKKLVEEGRLQPSRTRTTRNVPAIVEPAAVDRMLATLPKEAKSSPEAVTASIGRLFGYCTEETQFRASRRAQRFMQNHPGRRLPSHIRSAAVMSTAVLVATTSLFPDLSEPAALEGAKALRERFEGAAA